LKINEHKIKVLYYMAQESNTLLRNRCYNLQSYLAKRFMKNITLPDDIPTTSIEYIRFMENKIILPPRLIRSYNDIERQNQTEKLMSIVSRSILLLNIIESPTFSMESNPIIVKKRNLNELMNVVLIFSKIDIMTTKCPIYATLVSQYLVKDMPEIPENPQVNAYKFYRNTSIKTAMIQVLDYLLYLGFISKTMCEHIIEFERLARDRYEFVPHPAERNIEYFRKFGMCTYATPSDATLFSFLKNYFDHEDPERQINDPVELAHGAEIVKEVSCRVFRYYQI
jgi:hypothetical protein